MVVLVILIQIIGYKQVEDILHINAQNHIVFETGGNINTGEAMRITSDGHTLFSGLTTKNDPRNTNGMTLNQHLYFIPKLWCKWF